MDDVVSRPTQSQDHPLLRRRNSIKLTLLPHHNSSTTTSPSSDDMELLPIKPPTSYSYTSLKDLLPSVAVYSPKPNSAAPLAQPGSDICIRNRLVKQAACAYLQPKSISPGSAGGNFFHRLWPRVAAFIDFARHNFIRALEWTLRVIGIRSSR